jgi:hypothetical protein
MDSIAVLFGWDTAAVRKHISERLVDARIAVVEDERAPSLQLTITLVRPYSGRPEGSTSVLLTFASPQRVPGGRPSVLWESHSPKQTLTAFRMLPSVLTAGVDQVLDELIQTRNNASPLRAAPTRR